MVNSNWSLNDIQEYARDCVDTGTADTYSPDKEVPFESIDDYVCTLRNPGSMSTASFLWPSTSLSFQMAIAVALHHLPPGNMFVIKNGRKLPKRFDPKFNQGPGTGGSGPAETGFLAPEPAASPHDVVDLYHGISVTDLASLMEFGFKPTLGG